MPGDTAIGGGKGMIGLGARRGRVVLFAHSPRHIGFPRMGRRVGLHIVLFEACSAFTRVAARTRALSPIRDPLSEGFSHFVTSMTAPVASGWSDRGFQEGPGLSIGEQFPGTAASRLQPVNEVP